MKDRFQFQGYEGRVTREPQNDIFDFLRDQEYLQRGEVMLQSMPATIAEELMKIRQQNHVVASEVFEKNRKPFRNALRAIIGSVFADYSLPQSGGIDIGSGATGEMVEELLPSSARRNWVQIEANPASVVENKRRHPASTIVEGNYHQLGNLQLPIVTGLSSLDATCFPEDAIEAIRESLKTGGYLFHVQDVRPGVGYGIREMVQMGQKDPWVVEVMGKSDPLTYFVQGEQRFVNAGEMFRRGIGRALQKNSGMELLMNHWVTVKKPLPAQEMSRWYFMNVALHAPTFSTFDPRPYEEAAAVVTVARKI